MKNNSYICELISTNNNWQEVMESLNVKVKFKGDLAIFNYNVEVDFSNPLVQESRGIIINVISAEVVCWPFRKFGNWQESYVDTIDWSTARVQEKIDGSIIKLYYYDGAWRWATNGMIDAVEADCMYSSKNFLDVIKSASNYGMIDFDSLNKDYTYIFELVSPDTKVVIDYGYTKLFHLGTRNNKNGEEYIVEVELNQAYLQLLRTETERYGEIFNLDVATQWFKNVARLGFYSYDCILNRNDFSVFKLVARPRNNVEIRYDLPAFDELSILNYYDENVPELFIWQGALIS